jgi:hypothetical protein
MRGIRIKGLLHPLFVLTSVATAIPDGWAQIPGSGSRPVIPKTWDDAAMATLEVPLANPIGSPKQVSSDYYYRIPVRPIYKQYPIYAPGHEPPGYMDWLKKQEPQIFWDDKGHAPALQTEADWIEAGERVFESAIKFFPAEVVQQALPWLEKLHIPPTRDTVVPFFHYVVRQKGEVEAGFFSCSACHTRIMPDGSVLKGAQGSIPDVFLGFPPETELARRFQRMLFATPWITPDPLGPVDHMGLEELNAVKATIPPGVLGRHRTSIFFPVQVPDLIGVKDRKYLDRTGLQQHRSIVDLMRYAALNQGADDLANFNGFIPADFEGFKKLPDPATQTRYSDEQLYALGLYIYSLQPPANPNKFDAAAAHGQKVFERESCAMCHTPPLYTNNKLTLAEGFTPPPGATEKYDILPISVGTDPNLTLKTRRGTGYYKVPSLKGVWYRSMFGHSGWCATLEDWFDPRRVRDDYVATGFKPYGAKTYAVKGHPFGLDLSAEDKKALIVFLKTL